MTIAPALMSSARTGTGTDSWRSPEVVLERVRRIGPIIYDPCGNLENSTGALVVHSGPDGDGTDGLLQDWTAISAGGLVYANWPYSDSLEWAAKMAAEAMKGCRILGLGPARTDTRWWRIATGAADESCMWRGRLTFVGAPAPAPFPSAVLAFNIGRRAVVRAFSDVADVWSCP